MLKQKVRERDGRKCGEDERDREAKSETGRGKLGSEKCKGRKDE